MDAWIVTLLVTIALFGNTASLSERKHFELSCIYIAKNLCKKSMSRFLPSCDMCNWANMCVQPSNL